MLYKFKIDKGWCLVDVKKVATPVIGLTSMDINGDGVKELIVLTMRGVHILQVYLWKEEHHSEIKLIIFTFAILAQYGHCRGNIGRKNKKCKRTIIQTLKI